MWSIITIYNNGFLFNFFSYILILKYIYIYMLFFIFNILKNVIYSCDGKSELSVSITPVFNVPLEINLICWFDIYISSQY